MHAYSPVHCAARAPLQRVGRRYVAAALVSLALAAQPATAAPPGSHLFKTPLFPTGISRAFGSIWVVTHRSGYLYRIDPVANKTTASAKIADALCAEPVAAAGKLWVSGCDLGSAGPVEGFSYALDPHTLRVVRRVQGQWAIFGAGSIWTAHVRSVYRIDPRSGIVLAKVRVPGANPESVSEWGLDGVADGSVWATTDKTVVRISTTTNTVTKVIPLPGVQNPIFAEGNTGPSHLVVANGKIWLTQTPSLYEIDPATNVATQTPIKVGPFDEWGPGATLAVGRGSLWVRTTDRIVVQLDTKTLEVTGRYRATGGGGDITVAFGSLWVNNAGSDTTWRELIS